MNLNEHLKQIEHRLTALESKLSIQRPLSFDLPNISPPKNFSSTINTPTPLEIWFKENWLVNIGIFLILLAVGWFIFYAFANDWIGETARISLSVIVGSIIYSLGFWQLKNRLHLGQALIILGEAIIIISFFAGHQLYPLLSTLQTFVLMFSLINLTAIIAIKKNLESLGLATLLFAEIIPLLLHVDSPNFIFLMLYVSVINTAAMWMWIMRKWGKTFHVAWFATFFYSLSMVSIEEKWIVNLFLASFYLTFFLPLAIPIYKKKLPSLPLKGIAIFSTLNLALFFWPAYLCLFPWNVIFYFSGSLVLSALGCSIAKNWNQIKDKTDDVKHAISAIIGFSAIVLLFFGTDALTHHYFSYPVSFDAKTLTNFIEIVAAIAFAYFVLHSPLTASFMSLFFIVPLFDISINWLDILYAPFLTLKSAVLFTATASLIFAARVNFFQEANHEKKAQNSISIVLLIISAIFTMMAVWNFCHQIFPSNNIARGVALTTYIITAECLIYVGNLKMLKNLRVGGIAMIIFVLYRLLTLEIWSMPIAIRTITFIVIGLLLIGTAFFDKRYKSNLQF